MSENLQKDLVLSINEYAYVEDETKGHVICWVGPSKTSLSQSDKLVVFNSRTKRFENCGYKEAVKIFTTAPENWYCILKNPAKDNKHPEPGKSNNLPDDMHIGQKINIRGPVSFALYPGQMAKVVKGHSLRSNQYLLARVYEATSANSNKGEILDAEGNKVEINTNYVNGQLLVIKGTEVSFYIPPTGIEVIPINNDSDLGYVREAVTLERLEYCILKDEDGNKRYVHGPEVVFPEPTETFVTSPKGGYIFRAIELSKISGIYVKVIAEYDDNDSHHPIGEELFITGDDQMIYYPRPEHAIINYDEKIIHHAIAIPEGEGRYVLNRLTGEIKTVKGPLMYLPDPRYEVVVKRKLSPRECALIYPGNDEALQYNLALTEKSVEKSLKKSASLDWITQTAANSMNSTLANLEAKANISRGTSYTKPRTITIDNKYDGVVSVDVWTGYAVNVVSKSGKREVVCGPQTIMLDYDQTLGEIQLSTGNPKTTDKLEHTVFLNYENNKVADTINIETKDFVKANVKVSYCVSFDPSVKDKWFDVENYVKYLCDRERSRIKRMAKNYNIEEFYQHYSELVCAEALAAAEANSDEKPSLFFSENGMRVTDCEVLSIYVEDEIRVLLEEHQYEMVSRALALTNAEKRVAVAKKLAEAEAEEYKVKSEQLINQMNLSSIESTRRLEIQAAEHRANEAETKAAKEAERDLQVILDEVQKAKLAREKEVRDADLMLKQREAEIEAAKKKAYADTVEQIMASIQPELIEALKANANAELFKGVANGIAPYAMAKDESAAEFINTLLRGTTLENVIDNIKK